MRALRSALAAGRRSFRRRRPRDGGARASTAWFRLDDLVDHRASRDSRAAADDPAPHPRRPRRGAWRRGRTCSSSSTARISPIGSRGACARAARPSRSSTTSRRRCGRGGRGARARCAPMSIMCWRCCRSSRRCIAGSAARPAPMSGTRWPSRSSELRPERRRGAPPHGRSAGRAGAAGKPARRDRAAAGDLRRRDRPSSATDRPQFEVVLPTVPHRSTEVARRGRDWPVRPRIVVEPAEKHAAFRVRARGAREVRAP